MESINPEEKRPKKIKFAEDTKDYNKSDSNLIQFSKKKPNENNNNNNTSQKNKSSTSLINIENIEKNLLLSIENNEQVDANKIKLAEEIKFKSIPDKIIITDSYGFIKDQNNLNEDNYSHSNNNSLIKQGSLSSSDDEGNNKSKISILLSDIINHTNKPKTKEETLLQINARIEKWNYMLENFDSFSKYQYYKLKSRTRKGIPDNLRSLAWQKLAHINDYYISESYKKDFYSALSEIPVKKQIDSVILRDLDRTFPKCQFFREKYGDGQRQLYRVLTNYSKYNSEVGYVQGMGFLAALFLTYMDEASSFFMLHSLMKKYQMEGLFLPGFPDLKKRFYVLLSLEKKFLPNIYNLFKKEDIMASIYASEWFICLFSRNLEFDVLVRIMDCFLLEGFKVIYRFSLAFLKSKEEDIVNNVDEEKDIFEKLNSCFKEVDIDQLFKDAFKFSFSRKYINNIESIYEKNKNKDPKDCNDELMKLI